MKYTEIVRRAMADARDGERDSKDKAPAGERRGQGADRGGARGSEVPTKGGGGGGGPGGGGPGGGGGGGMRPSRGMFGFVAVLLSLMLLFLLFQGLMGGSGSAMSFKEFEALYQGDKIVRDSVRINDLGLVARKKSAEGDAQVTVRFGAPERELMVHKINLLTKDEVKIETTSPLVTMLWSLLPFLIISLLIFYFLIRSLRGAGGGAGGMLGSFGKSKHRLIAKEKTGVTFGDVAGIDEAKAEVDEIIQFLKNPKKFARLGGRIPRGVLLVGDPGCGKTLLAKAIAGEADVPFFSISGSDFVEMFVGVGASRVRDLFKQAKDSAPCIIFLDEIDAVGRRRGGGFSSGGHDEREQTLNAILVEMDGFATSDGVIVIAATNRADVLDPALTRPGRFDRQITVPLPDVKGRLDILRVHGKNKKLGPDVDLERVARATPMFSGADLMAIMNEAAISATLADKDFIEMEDLEEARDKVKFGRARKSRVREADENRLVAYHEAGHAVLQAMLKDADPLHKVTIIPRGGAGGATFSLPEKDRMGYGLKWIAATLKVLCGGRIAEARAMNDVSSGASQDIAMATNLARTMVEQWGMSPRLGFVRYSGLDSREMFMPERGFSDETAKVIDQEVQRIVSEAYAESDRLLSESWEKVAAVAEALLKYETLDAAEVHKIMRGESLGKPTISDLLAAEARKVRELAAASSAAAKVPGIGELPGGPVPSPA